MQRKETRDIPRELPDHPSVVQGDYCTYAEGSEEPLLRIGNRAVLLKAVLEVILRTGAPPRYLVSRDYSGSYTYCQLVEWGEEVAALLTAAAQEVRARRAAS